MTRNRIWHHRANTFARALMLVIMMALLWPAGNAFAQTDDSLPVRKQKAEDLVKPEKFTEALPILEEVAAAEPDNAHTQFKWGFALIGQAIATKDAAERKAMRIRARNSFLKAKDEHTSELQS